jgi:DNA-binding protein H-NS
MSAVNIKNLSVAQLLSLRADIDKQLQFKRSELQRQLEEIGGSGGGPRRGVRKGTKAVPKYRDAQGNTWAGRGAQPRWLAAALKTGKKLEDFLIARPATTKRRAKRG